MENMIKIGLSGNRYSGKDVCCRIFEQIGVPVFNADVVLKFILNYNYEINYKIRSTFGDVFSLKGDLLDLNKFTEKRKFDDLIDVIEYELLNAYDLFNKNNKQKVYTIFHSSILFEREWSKIMDYNINVFSSKDERIQRCKKSTKLEEYKVKQLMSSEMDELVKNSLSDFIINNYPAASIAHGDITDQISRIDQKIVDKYLLREQTTYGENFNPNLV
jgi:dephospho-CoA kinase